MREEAVAKGRINKTNVDKLLCPCSKAMDNLWDEYCAVSGLSFCHLDARHLLCSGRVTVACKKQRLGCTVP